MKKVINTIEVDISEKNREIGIKFIKIILKKYYKEITKILRKIYL